MTQKRKSILMIAPHEPTKDPRIQWEASSAAKNFDVLLIGLQNETHSAPERESKDGYEIRRKPIKPQQMDRIYFFFFTLQSAPIPLAFVLALAYLFMIPAFGVGKILFKWIQPKANPLISDIIDLVWYVSFIGCSTKSFLREIKQLPQKPDIIHCNDLLALMTGILAKKKYGCKVVYDAHEYYPYSDPKAGRFQQTMLRLFETLLIRQADEVITVNPLLADEIKNGYRLQKVLSVPNTAPWIENQKQALPGQMTQLAKGRVKFLFQGGFAPARGIEELIHAWVHVDQNKSALFLRGPKGPFRDKYMNLAKNLYLLERSIFFLDPVTEDDLIEAAIEADVGLIPYMPVLINHIKACPNKLSQYMQAGLTIVSNHLLYVKQIIEESQTGITYHSQESLVSAIRYVSEDFPFREQCKKNALDYSKNEFNWQKSYPTLENIYNAL